MIVSLVVCLVGWLIGYLADRSIDWLIDCDGDKNIFLSAWNWHAHSVRVLYKAIQLVLSLTQSAIDWLIGCFFRWLVSWFVNWSIIRLIRELRQRTRRRRGWCLLKNEFIFCKRNSRGILDLLGTPQARSKNELKLNMQRRHSIPNGNTKDLPSSSAFRRRHKTLVISCSCFAEDGIKMYK